MIFSKQVQDKNARAGLINIQGIRVPTPVFMPVGTQATVKAINVRELEEIDYSIILSNSYHLYLRPSDELIQKMGGLHRFMNWNRLILTDSGGFQLFSLKKLRKKISEEGVTFQSHLDGSSHFLSPEKVIKIQQNLGSDIMMVLDECLEPCSSYEDTKKSCDLTLHWAKRSYLEKENLAKKSEFLEKESKPSKKDSAGYSHKKQKLFGIIQGGLYKDLRKDCLQRLAEISFDGYAIGGLSVGESKAEMYSMLQFITPQMDAEKPRYLMGVGHPLDILSGVESGIDMFDSVLATRNARNGSLLTSYGWLSIKKKDFEKDANPIDSGCSCIVCKKYSRAYIRHLFRSNEFLSAQLNSYHNLYFMKSFMDSLRKSILEKKFSAFKKEFSLKFSSQQLQ